MEWEQTERTLPENAKRMEELHSNLDDSLATLAGQQRERQVEQLASQVRAEQVERNCIENTKRMEELHSNLGDSHATQIGQQRERQEDQLISAQVQANAPATCFVAGVATQQRVRFQLPERRYA